MRRAVKVKALSTRVPLRKAATSANQAARRNFPAWIDASETMVAFPAKGASPRVRDGLVLRAVAKKKNAAGGGAQHGRGTR
jgi:hypothetical protein